MRVELTKGNSASEKDIAFLAQKLGTQLPPDLLAFLHLYDGAEPEPNIFKVGTTNEAGVNGFIPVRDIAREAQNIENLGAGSFPIAWAEGGNYIIIDRASGGAVFFWDHELPGSPTKLADSFLSFLDLLEPFDATTIQLKPGQVITTWIDPDFLKTLKK
ncbi:SMI1/KNR4 family protein [Devosia sp.]|uniref:SMI1/KNR4 family protein n=1 Tax=Devosia sp. TaxID=1871048 RepID=UPI0019F328C5|nr:SMI1/KNR4 family protein [Devosia sp.]MBE0581672.1 SMI1/KNR4 family protein [Devosia sp.]